MVVNGKPRRSSHWDFQSVFHFVNLPMHTDPITISNCSWRVWSLIVFLKELQTDLGEYVLVRSCQQARP